MVLPDGKDSARDVVVFLDAAHAAGSEEEAAQRGAVAALQRVAGERSLHRVLPLTYRDLWQALGVQVCGMRLITPCALEDNMRPPECKGRLASQ